MKPEAENTIDKTFRRLSEYEVQPPPEVWDALKDMLSHSKRKRLLWIRLLAAAAILAFAVMTGYYLRHQNQPIALQSPAKDDSNLYPGNARIAAQEVITEPQALKEKEIQAVLPDKIFRQDFDKSSLSGEINPGTEKVPSESEKSFLPLLKSKNAYISSSGMGFSLRGIREKLLLAILPAELGTQVETEADGNSSIPQRFIIDGQAGPVLAYRSINEKSSANMASASGTSFGKVEEPLATYGGNIRIQYKIANRISVGTGLGYSGMGMKWKQTFASETYATATNEILQYKDASSLSNGPLASNSLGTIPALEHINSGRLNSVLPAENLFSRVQFIQYLGYIEVPFTIRYALLEKKLGVSVSTGVVNHFLVRNEVIMNSGGAETGLGRTEGVRHWNYSGTALLGIDYKLTQNLRMRIEPAFKYYLNASNTSGMHSTHLYSLSVFSGFTYIF